MVEDRFLKYVNKTNTCWVWTGAIGKNGYGTLTVNKKFKASHRIAYELYKGEIPKGLEVCHTCDNTKCVNPEHLWVGTHSQNMRDKYNKGRSNTTGRKDTIDTRLSDKQIIDIKNKYKPYKYTMKMLSEEYNVCQSSINNILKEK